MAYARYTPLPLPKVGFIVARDLAAQLIRLVTARKRRTKDVVKSEYDTRTYKPYLDKKIWLNYNNLTEYLENEFSFTVSGENFVGKIDNKIVQILKSEYYRYHFQIFRGLLKEAAGSQDDLVELGCGIGRNIFLLASENHWGELYGYDISKNAVQSAHEITRHFNLTHVNFDDMDLTNSRDPNFKKLSGKVVYTYYCLEQLKHSIPEIIERLIESGIKKAIHIEPTYELLNIFSPKDWLTYLYIKRMDYLDNLLKTLRKFEKEGRVQIVGARRLYYSHAHKNDSTYVCWVPAKPQ